MYKRDADDNLILIVIIFGMVIPMMAWIYAFIDLLLTISAMKMDLSPAIVVAGSLAGA